jgi:hypothetical protein
MTQARMHHLTIGILTIAITVALAFATNTVPASARTFNFNSAGSMVQQPLPPQWGCVIRRALSGGKFHCQHHSAR